MSLLPPPPGEILGFEWALKLATEDLALLRLDVCRLEDRLAQEFCPGLANKLSGLEPSVSNSPAT